MALGKNKKLGKAGKAGKKKAADPFTRKEWYDIKAPAVFTHPLAGKTPVSRTAGTKISSESLKGRVFTVSLADLQKNEADDYRKIKLVGQEVKAKALLTNFYGMDVTRDKLNTLIKKWQTLIEAHADVKTTDGYVFRLFCFATTKKQKIPGKNTTAYAKSSAIRAVRKKMVEIMTAEASKSDLKELVTKFIPETIGKDIEKECNKILPIQNVLIRKVKTIKAPRFDITKLMEMHEGGADASKTIKEAPLVETLAGSGGRL